MTTLTSSASRTSIPSLPAVALATVAGAVACNALGIFADGTEGAEHSAGEFWFISAVIVVAAGVVFGLVVPKALASTRTAGIGLTLSILGALLVVPAFWSGLPPVLAVGGLLLGLAARGRSTKATVAVVLGALATIAYAAVYVLDWMATNDIAGM